MPITPEQLCRSGSEDGHQLALFCWAATSGIPELKWLFHIPNGGYRDKREAGKLKAMGVKSGVPDIFLPVAGKFSSKGLWIELKRPKQNKIIYGGGRNQGKTLAMKEGTVSKEQDEWLEYLGSQGYANRICFGWEEARDCLLEYLQVPMIQVTNPQYFEWLNRKSNPNEWK